MARDKVSSHESKFDILYRTLVRREHSTRSSPGRRSGRKSRKRVRLVLALSFISLCLVAGVWLTDGYLWRMPASSGNSLHRAAVIDELSLTYSDPYFIHNITESLRSSGYSVDYYPPDQVTVELFRSLPSKNYGLVIIRSHTASSAGIITGEQYSQNRYVYEQLADQLVRGVVPPSGQTYFAIEAGFVGSEMQGRFPDSTIVLMGCGGLQGKPQLAKAFIDKGARFFVGWTDAVTAAQTDLTVSLLIHEIAGGSSVSQAVDSASHYPDPLYNSRLNYMSWEQVSGQQLDSFLYALTSWSTIALLLILGPAVVILLPKILSKR
jgi:hypothetical protein